MTDTPVTTTEPVVPTPAPVEAKKPWESKTLITGVITAILPFIPVVGPWIQANPEIYAVILSSLFAALRVATKDKLVLK
jgi:hypothetical protein